MNISFFIAKRYLFSKKNRNAINIISGISVMVVTVSTAALIIVLSSINGFGKLINEQISSYAPDLLIQPAKGKTFSVNEEVFNKIKKLKNVEYFAEILEENVLVKYGNRQLICKIKGVPQDYGKKFKIDTAVTYGLYKTHGTTHETAVFGAEISYSLGISIDAGRTVSIWVPNRNSIQIHNPQQSFNTVNVIPVGIISLDQEFDSKYILSSNVLVRKLTNRDSTSVNFIEILVRNKQEIHNVKKQISKLLGENYIIKDIYEQFDVYKVMKSERLAAFIIMLFIVLVASFSIVGSVTMLIIEKKEDIFTLQSLGAPLLSIKKTFFLEGLLISLTGAVLGIIFGGLISIAQQKFGIVTFPAEGNYIVEAYPVDVKIQDFILSFFSVMIVGSFVSLYPAIKIRTHIDKKK